MGLRVLFIINLVFLVIQTANAGTPGCVAKTIRDNLQGALFLHGLNPALYKTPMVERAESILIQLGEKNPKDVQKKIAAWLSIVEQTHIGRRDEPEVLNRLKDYYYQEHVISEENFPESYFDLQKKIARERGLEETRLSPELRAEHMRVIIEDQKKSLDSWIEYLTSNDAYYPMWAKVWAFNGMTRIGKIDAASGNVVSRSAKTVSPFIDVNREALSLSIEAVEKLLNAKQKGLKYKDVEPNAKLRELVQGGNFGKIYGFYSHALAQNAIDLTVTEGAWVKYPRGSDPGPLVKSLQCKNTGWCTAGESTAQKQLADGDFYVYYSHDALGRPKNPRLAIRMNGDQIGEVRGIGPDQEIDPHIVSTEILNQKLKEFGLEGERYLKRSADMKLLSQIEAKTNALEELTESELRFIHEIDSKIEGFGNKPAPRIFEIRSMRDRRKDFAVIFHVKPEEVSFTAEEALSGKIKVHYGDLELRGLDDIQGIKFPEVVVGKLNMGMVETAEDCELPKVVYGDIYAHMKSAKNVTFPKEVHGRVYLKRLKSAQNVKLPEVIHGELELEGLTSAEGLTFPEKVHGYLKLSALKSARGLKLPKEIDGNLYLDGLTSAEGLVLPEKVTGQIDLRRLTTSEGLILPAKFKGKVILPAGIEPRWID